jgi:TonB family protein
MNPSRVLLSLALLAATALAAPAAFESARALPDNPMPTYPPALRFDGITRGRAVLAISIAADGHVKDMLPLAYTNVRFAHTSMDALRDWHFTPARLDGEVVPVQLELTFEYTLEGAVISTNVSDHYLFDRFEYAGDNALTYQPVGAGHVDHPPVRISGAAPSYAVNAEQEGVRGRVKVRFYIDEQGAVRLPAVTGTANPYLMEQAVMAVRTWKFEPVTKLGRPVLVVAQQEFNFGDGKR